MIFQKIRLPQPLQTVDKKEVFTRERLDAGSVSFFL